MRRLSGVFSAVVLVGVLSTPASAQEDAWKNQWYWGAQAGAYIFSTATQSNSTAFDFGVDWLITAERVGLRIGFDQVMFADGTTGAIPDAGSVGGLRAVTFSSMQRWQGEMYGFAHTGLLQIAATGGFAIHHITNAQATGSFASPQEQDAVERAVAEVTSKAFLTLGATARYLVGRRWAAFAKYQYMPQGEEFLITSGSHAITAGISYALTVASEQVTTER